VTLQLPSSQTYLTLCTYKRVEWCAVWWWWCIVVVVVVVVAIVVAAECVCV
jgi:hypothetical protein